MEDFFIGIMELQEAKNHQLRLSSEGLSLVLKTHKETCTTGCKVTVEVWGKSQDSERLSSYFTSDYLKHMQGHVPNFEHLREVFDPSADEVICQACGMKFRPTERECPDCGLVY